MIKRAELSWLAEVGHFTKLCFPLRLNDSLADPIMLKFIQEKFWQLNKNIPSFIVIFVGLLVYTSSQNFNDI